jgi:hypothetical protein
MLYKIRCESRIAGQSACGGPLGLRWGFETASIIPIVGTNQNPKNLSTTITRTTFTVGIWEIKCEIKKNDSFNHMDGAIFDEPECMG